jgi:hypothetical protein
VLAAVSGLDTPQLRFTGNQFAAEAGTGTCDICRTGMWQRLP